ncbi:MAG: PEP-CTERM sorting domain-containing protein [Phycisphaerae bacterium]|nr:PEP-CTERM sorting domain-containing protein [Phycisphaerae bacterium]
MTNVFRILTCMLLAAAALPAMGAIYADQTQIDLFRHYDRATGQQLVTVESAQNSRTDVLIDGGRQNQQVDGNTARWDMLFTLNDVYYASRLELYYTNYHPDSFSIYYSTTGLDDDWTPLVLNETSQMTSHQDKWVFMLPGGDDGTAIKYLKIVQEPSSVDNHIRMDSIYLFAAANNTFDDQKDGFNIMVNAVNRPTYAGSDNGVTFVSENPTIAFNNSRNGWVRAYGAEGQADGLAWFVVPLGEVKELWGINMGFLDGWGCCYIDVSTADEMPIASALTDGYDADAWTSIYANPAAQSTQFIWLNEGDGVEAKWIRVRFAGGNAMSEMELYVSAIPEPATMSLLALGGLALLRRRK